MVLFAVKKIKKLYPLHLIMLFFGVVYSLKNGADPQGFFKLLLKTVLLIQTWFSVGYQVFNTVAWYLSVSLFLYFMFPLVLPLVKRGSFKESAFRIVLVYLIQLSIGYYISRYTGYAVKWAAYCHPLYRLGDFLEGALTASSFIKIQKTNRRKGRLFSKRMCSALEIIAVVSNIAVCASYSRVAERAQWFAFTCLFAPVSLLLVYAFSLNNGILSDFLKKRIIYWLAAISPYGFLIHRLVIYYFYDFVVEVMHRKSLPYMVEIAVPFAITVAGVYLYLLAVKIVAGWKRAV
jgi:peptidoglycan/LPS O-acetylase OafA/YrhL